MKFFSHKTINLQIIYYLSVISYFSANISNITYINITYIKSNQFLTFKFLSFYFLKNIFICLTIGLAHQFE